MRELYLNGGGGLKLPIEILKRYSLQHASQWTLENLQQVHRALVEPLLLYW